MAVMMSTGFGVCGGESRMTEFLVTGGVALAVGGLCMKFAMRRKWMLVVGFVLALFGFAIYMWPGFFGVDKESQGGLAAVCEALSAFYPSRGGFEAKFESSAWYWLFHLLAIIYISMILVVLFAGELVNWCLIAWRCLLDRFMNRSPINMFWGYSAEAKILAQGIDDGKGSVVFVIQESKRLWLGLNDDEGVHEVAKAGWKWVTLAPSARKYLSREKRHFFVGPDGHANVAEAQKLVQRLVDSGFKGETTIYVRMWPDAEEDAVYRWVDCWNAKIQKMKSRIEIVAVREESIVSRKFLVDHPMLDCPDVDVDVSNASVSGEFKILLVGFGVQGERLMCDMICDAQFLDKHGKKIPISVDVVDRDASTFGWFKMNCREVCERYRIDFKAYDMRSTEFWDWMCQDQRPKYNRIVICTQDDVTNLKLAGQIAVSYAQRYGCHREEIKRTVFARVRRPSLVKVLSAGIDSYQLFGDMRETYSSEWLLKDRWDRGAIFVNGVWCARYDADKPAGEDPLGWYQGNQCRGLAYWCRQTTFNKESSRASFLHMRNILRLMGYDTRPSRSGDAHPEKKMSAEDKRMLIAKLTSRMLDGSCREVLSASEHMRWMAFHLVRGWKVWVPTEAELMELSAGGKKMVEPSSNKRSYLHANLVDFDQLDACDKVFNTVNRRNGKPLVDSKKKDDDIVYGLAAVFAADFAVDAK